MLVIKCKWTKLISVIVKNKPTESIEYKNYSEGMSEFVFSQFNLIYRPRKQLRGCEPSIQI